MEMKLGNRGRDNESRAANKRRRIKNEARTFLTLASIVTSSTLITKSGEKQVWLGGHIGGYERFDWMLTAPNESSWWETRATRDCVSLSEMKAERASLAGVSTTFHTDDTAIRCRNIRTS